MNAFDAIAIVAEQKIQEALEQGLFDNLPGAGRPLQLDDLSHLPPESRMAYTILKNSGYLEPRNDLPHLPEAELKRTSPDEGNTCGRMRRLNVLLGKVRQKRAPKTGLLADGLPPLPDSPYLEQLLKKI